MIKVTKEEAMAIRRLAPESHVTIVNRQSNHKKYFAEENRETDAILREMRKQNVIYSAGKFDPEPKPQFQIPFKPKPKHSENRHRHSGGYNDQPSAQFDERRPRSQRP